MSTMPIKPGSPLDFEGIFSPQYMPAVVTAFSAGLKSFGQRQQGKALVEAAGRKQQAATFEAEQMRINAGQAAAASQRDAYFKNLEGKRLLSAIQARAGAGATDPTILNIMGQASAQAAYNAQMAIYGGQDKARLLRMQASGKEYDAALAMQDAKSAQRGYRFASIAPLVGTGVKSLYEKYYPKDMFGGASVPDVADPSTLEWGDW